MIFRPSSSIKPPHEERTYSILAVTALIAVLVLLGILQYRWSGEISQAASDRMQSNLHKSMGEFRERLTRELGDACLSLQPSPDLRPGAFAVQYAETFQQWQRSSPHGLLIGAAYLANQPSPAAPIELFRLQTETGKLDRVAWPGSLNRLRHALETMGSNAPPLRRFSPQPPGSSASGPGRRETFWAIDQSTPALLYLMPVDAYSANRAGASSRWLIIQMDLGFLQQHILPELVRQQFAVSGQMEFKVAIIDGSQPKPVVIYTSDEGFGQGASHFAGTMPLFAPPGPPDRPEAIPPSGIEPLELPPVRQQESVRLFALRFGPDEGEWELVVDPRSGSLEAAVASLRRRNLAVSFGILIVLTCTIGAIVAISFKARRLAQLQMRFVTGVTHELRTPLAIISSAAENIKDGVVSKPGQVARYGAVIHRQAKQLMQLVEQVLLFASSQRSRLQYELEPVEVGPIIEMALENGGASGVTVERRLAPDLPLVMANPGALTQCLQNLIVNAIKYGGPDGWLSVKAWQSDDSGQKEVHISIEDRGIGIDRSEMAHIFGPFYRSPEVAGSAVHGTGLGLPLTKSMTEAMGGRITVESERGRGSSFTLHLIAADFGEPSDANHLDNELRAPYV